MANTAVNIYQGETGYSGYSGVSGYSGKSGFSGTSGYSGTSGFSGVSGYSGDNPGTSGYSGYSGISGYTGGTSGYSGFSGYSGTGGDAPSVVVKTGDQTSTSTSYADVTDLSFSVLANKTYFIETYLYVTNSLVSGSTYGTHISMNGPASPTFLGMISYSAGSVSGYDTDNSLGIGSSILMRVDAIFKNGANAGTLTLRVRAKNGTSTSTVKAGSTLKYKQVD